MQLRVGIAGYGVVGKRRRHCISDHPLMRTVAVCDQSFAESGKFSDGVSYFQHYKQLLEQPLDVLFVCLPNFIAAQVTKAGLERGLHVFCEKPPGRDVSDIVSVREVEALKPKLKLKYGFNHRYHDSVQHALQLADSGKLGPLVNLKGVYGKSKFISFGKGSDWRVERELAGGGILLDQGIHMLDLMCLFAGEFSEVYSFVSNAFWNHNVEDNAYALMRSSNGVVAMLHSTATQWRHRFDLDLCFAKGSICLSGILSSTKSYGAETILVSWRDENNDAGDPLEQSTRYSKDPSWAREIDEFADAIVNNKPIVHGTSADALRSMQLIYKIYCADMEWKQRWGLNEGALDQEQSDQPLVANLK